MVERMKPICFGSLFLLLIVTFVYGVGKRDYGDECDPKHNYAKEEEKRCDSDKGLYCHERKGECNCFVSGSYYQQGSCRARVSQYCGISDGFRVDCVKRSFCNTTLSLCQCYQGMEFNYERTACNSAERWTNGSATIELLVGTSLLLTLFLKIIS